MEFKDLQQTDELMNEGVWMRLDREGAMIRLRHTYSRAYTLAREAAEKKLRYRSGYRPDKELSSDETNEIMREAVARGLIVDWKKFTKDGVDVPFSPEAAEDWLKLPSLLLKLVTMGAEEGNFRRENLEILAGN